MNIEEIGRHLEQYDFDYYLEEAMRRVPEGVDKREGSIIYDAIAPACYLLALKTMELKHAMQETFVASASDGYLDLRSNELGVTRIEATQALVKATITATDGETLQLQIGNRFSSIGDNPIYYQVSQIGEEDDVYYLTAEDLGSRGNEYIGTILPIDHLNNFGEARITEIEIPARDVESDDSLRDRVLSSRGTLAFGGNLQDYREKINEIEGVGDAQIYSTWNGGGTVLIVIINNEYQMPSSTLVEQVQEDVDPGESGDGLGWAPIGHKVTVQAPTEAVLDISVEVTFDFDSDNSETRTQVLARIESYFDFMRRNWATLTSGTYQTLVSRAQISSAVLNVEGVNNVGAVRINGAEEDFQIEERHLPLLGEVTII